MDCFCCRQVVPMGRKAKVRPWVEFDDTPPPPPGTAVHTHYLEQTTYRWALVCQPCYAALDNGTGWAVIDGGPDFGGRAFTMAGRSRVGQAAVMDQAEYDRWQQHEASKLGL